MADCEYCKIIKEKHNKVYEDDLVYAFATDKPTSAGHIIIIPKEHYPIFEAVPDKTAGHIFFIANKISVSVFETLGAHGTNILAQNGIEAGQEIAHFSLHVLPRRENDGLNMEWPPKQIDDNEMGTTEILLKDNMKQVGIFEQETKAPVEIKEEPGEVIKQKDDKENYLVKQLRRMP